jgi:hypothetical protein
MLVAKTHTLAPEMDEDLESTLREPADAIA